jgi:hypothetical protein
VRGERVGTEEQDQAQDHPQQSHDVAPLISTRLI